MGSDLYTTGFVQDETNRQFKKLKQDCIKLEQNRNYLHKKLFELQEKADIIVDRQIRLMNNPDEELKKEQDQDMWYLVMLVHTLEI